MKAFDRAIAAAGGISNLAKKLGYAQSRVSNWRTRGVPTKEAPKVEEAVDRVVTRRDLCPDFPWEIDSVT
jgi:DNA-binding transcriptional regulator YdaS (Cro superfamily)